MTIHWKALEKSTDGTISFSIQSFSGINAFHEFFSKDINPARVKNYIWTFYLITSLLTTTSLTASKLIFYLLLTFLKILSQNKVTSKIYSNSNSIHIHEGSIPITTSMTYLCICLIWIWHARPKQMLQRKCSKELAYCDVTSTETFEFIFNFIMHAPPNPWMCSLSTTQLQFTSH
jgi:hypothetical protein